MKKGDAEIFQKISKVEKRTLLQSLIATKTEMIVKGDEEKIFYMYVSEITHPHLIECSLSSTSERPRIHQDVIVSIEHGADRYYAMTRLTIENERYNLDISRDIFLLQRRKAARLQLPSAMKQSANIIELGGKTVFVSVLIENSV